MENDRCTDGSRQGYPEWLPPEFIAMAPSGDELLAFCSKWRVEELSVWGRHAYGTANPVEPIRMVVRFRPSASVSILTLERMAEQLSEAFGRPVHLIEEAEVLLGANPILRRRVLTSARTLYRA
jgi:predicted nucleotidyltransferase